jgi:glutamate decarboxylase
MSLRSRKAIEPHLDESIFGTRALAQPLPKYRFPAHENSAADILQMVADELYLDGNARQNLATFCQT